ncbi:MAG: AraC family transcriptional regulator [Butyrivibrio sp.]
MKYLDYKENKKQGTEDFPVAFYHVTPNSPRYEMPYHWHPQIEIIRIIKGKFRLILDGEIHELTNGDVVYITDGVSHGGTPENCIYECIVFDLKILQKSDNRSRELLRKLSRHEIFINPMALNEGNVPDSYISAVFESMYGGAGMETIGALYMLYGRILKNELYSINDSANPSFTAHSLKFKKALDYIESHYTENISLEDMAKAAGMSPKYFCRYFRQMTDKTPVKYLNYYRIECACEQLATHSISVTDAALNNGFNDISYFIKTFKQLKGITPRQYLQASLNPVT